MRGAYEQWGAFALWGTSVRRGASETWGTFEEIGMSVSEVAFEQRWALN